MNELHTFQSEFIENSCYRMDESLRMINISLDKVSEEQVWLKPNIALNSIGNLILHLCGNMTQYGLSSLNETEDKRNRDVEFSIEGGLTKKQLFEKLSDTVGKVKASFQEVSLERLVTLKQVQGFEFSGIGNIIHVVEHFSYHTGQIAFWVKQLNNKQLGFYEGHDLNTLNDD
ncbi:MAG: DinB family protein [Croceivirga sp.]